MPRHSSIHYNGDHPVKLGILPLCAVAVVLAHCQRAIPNDSPNGQATKGCTLRLHVDGLRNSIGVVGTAIYKSPAGWPEDASRAFRRWPTPIATGQREVTVVAQDLPPGDYGVVVIHDENMNQKLDRNLFGWPREGFGFANNPHVRLSAPSFKEAVIHVTCPDTDTKIHMQYR